MDRSERLKDVFIHFDMHNEYTLSADSVQLEDFFHEEEIPDIITAEWISQKIGRDYRNLDSFLNMWGFFDHIEVTIEVQDRRDNPAYHGDNTMFSDPEYKSPQYIDVSTAERLFT